MGDKYESILIELGKDLFISDQRGVGGKWRDVFEEKVKEDKFFVLKDPDGNIYKIRFNAMLNDSGERGYTKFEYALLK